MHAPTPLPPPVLALALALAAGPATPAATSPRAQEPALRGLDPVSLCEGRERPGRPGLELARGRFRYRFADESSRARFEAEPERWGIQWGGGCARMGPLSGAGSPDRWAVHDGRIYVFASDGCREGFLSEPERFVAPRTAGAVELADDTPERRAAGAAWIDRAVEAAGGLAALDRPAGLRLVFEGPQGDWSQRRELVVSRAGDVLRRVTWTPAGDDGDRAGEELESVWCLSAEPYGVAREGEHELAFPVTSPDQRDDVRRLALREPLAILWARGAPDFVAVHLGPGELDGASVEDLLVACHGLVTRLHLEPDSGRIEGLSWRGRVTDGVTREVVERFVEWRSVDGVELPVARATRVDGEETPAAGPAWTAVELPAELGAGTFERGPEGGR